MHYVSKQTMEASSSPASKQFELLHHSNPGSMLHGWPLTSAVLPSGDYRDLQTLKEFTEAMGPEFQGSVAKMLSRVT